MSFFSLLASLSSFCQRRTGGDSLTAEADRQWCVVTWSSANLMTLTATGDLRKSRLTTSAVTSIHSQPNSPGTRWFSVTRTKRGDKNTFDVGLTHKRTRAVARKIITPTHVDVSSWRRTLARRRTWMPRLLLQKRVLVWNIKENVQGCNSECKCIWASSYSRPRIDCRQRKSFTPYEKIKILKKKICVWSRSARNSSHISALRYLHESQRMKVRLCPAAHGKKPNVCLFVCLRVCFVLFLILH